jgi:O-antigen/teichoic acid export membrane protein
MHKSVIINFIGGAWLGILIVLTTPWFVSDLGLEGFALVGIWQLLFYFALIFDFGLGAACARELSRSTGLNPGRARYRSLLAVFERPIVSVGVVLSLLIAVAAPWVAESWLNVRGYQEEEVTVIIRLMAVSVGLQFIAAFHLNALAGMQRMVAMNAVQIFNNSMRYLGGSVVLLLADGIVGFFVFQVLAALLGLALARWAVFRAVASVAEVDVPPQYADSGVSLKKYMAFSGGMFFTALCGALLTNADRLVVSRMMSAEALGHYSIALTAIGLLQTLVFAFHRAYFPRFAQLHAAGESERLKRVYEQACALVGLILVPVGLLFAVFAPEIYTVWLGWTDTDAVLVSRLLVLGFVLSGVMWLPAAYQQAIGWTRMHATLMAVTVLCGVPLLVLLIARFGLPGAAALMLLHGFVEITLGLWLMNRVCFPGANLRWYRDVLLTPLVMALPVVLLSRFLLPPDLGRVALGGWVGGTCVALALGVAAARRFGRTR